MTTATEIKPTMSVKEIAEMLDVCEDTVYEGLRQGKIPNHRLGTKYIINRRQFMDWFYNAPSTPVTQR